MLDPSVLTVGFARRFATYKRATLLLSEPDRLRALLHDAERPIQFVFAGKAHPADTPGKELIQRIEQFARQADVRHRFVFLTDYDISIARTMYHGCDVWLNTPRRPHEACGTSGMKAALNGALNCSILDGWWDECYDPTTAATAGRSSRPRTTRTRTGATCARPASLFGILENQVVPRFYDRGRDGVPRQWVSMVLQAWATLGPEVTASRMVRDYTPDLYEPAAASSIKLAAAGGKAAVELAAWRERVEAAWDGVSITSVDVDDDGAPRPATTVASRSASTSAGSPRTTCACRSCTARRPRRRVHEHRGRRAGARPDPARTPVRSRSPSPARTASSARVFPVHDGLANPYDLGRMVWAE